MKYNSAIKGEKIVPFAETWMDLQFFIQSEVSQKNKNKYCIILLIYVNKENDTVELILKAEIESQM